MWRVVAPGQGVTALVFGDYRLCLLFIHPPAHGSEVGPAARNTLDSARIPRASKLLICGLFQKVRVLAQDGDNAVTESFFGTLKTELLHRRSWPTRRMAKDAVASYIEGFYNPYRLHSSLDYNSSMVFERIHDLKTAHAR